MGVWSGGGVEGVEWWGVRDVEGVGVVGVLGVWSGGGVRGVRSGGGCEGCGRCVECGGVG